METIFFAANGLNRLGRPSEVLVVVGITMVILIQMLIFASRYVKVGPNQLLVVSGRKIRIIGPDGQPQEVGYRLVTGGGTFVWPVLEKADVLSLEAFPVEIKGFTIETASRRRVVVDASAQMKIGNDAPSLHAAATSLLSKTRDEIKALARQTIEGQMRMVVSSTPQEQLAADRAALAQRVRNAAASDLAKVGLTVVSFSLDQVCTG